MNSKRMFYVMLVIMFLTVGGTGFIYYFAINTLSRTLTAIDKKETELSDLSNDLQSFAVSNAQYTTLRSSLGDIDKVLPKTKDQSVVIEQLKYIGAISNISMGGFSFQGGSSAAADASGTVGGPSASSLTTVSEINGASVMTTTISNGDVAYADFVGFLNNIKEFRRPFRVTSIQVTPLDSLAERVSFSVDVEAFLVTPEGAPTAVAPASGTPPPPIKGGK